MTADGWRGRDLTPRQRDLFNVVVQGSSSVDEQLMFVGVYATQLGADEDDVKAVRDQLLTGHIAEAH